MARLTEEEMRYSSLEVPWGGEEDLKRAARSRWLVAIVYIIVVLAGAVLPVFFPDVDEGTFALVYTVVVIGGAILMIAVLSRPTSRPPGADVSVRGGTAIESGVTRRLRPGETYYLSMRFNLIVYVMVPMIVVMAALMAFIPDRTAVLIIGGVTALLALITIILINFEVRADRKTLSFKFGHFGTELPLDSITHISVTKVNAMRDFMGYGVRTGPDGTKGYILQGDVGFRVETDRGKRYVVTIPDPESLVEYVKAAKAERGTG